MEDDDIDRRRTVFQALYDFNAEDPGAEISSDGLERLTHLSSEEVSRCVMYLRQKELVATQDFFGGGFSVRITTRGIDSIEDQSVVSRKTSKLASFRPNNETNHQISELTRRQIVDMMLLRNRQFHGEIGLVEFLARIWNLSSMRSSDPRFLDAAGDIEQHTVSNADWTYHYLLYEYLKILRCDDEIFAKFVETSVHPVVLRNSDEASSAIAEINELLKDDRCMLNVASYISGRPVYKVEYAVHKPRDVGTNEYDVMLSLAGEDRDYVGKVAKILDDSGTRVFYDRYEEISLWGKDMNVHFQRVIKQARYFVPFISKHYVAKMWPTAEARAALARAISEKREFVLPARFDNSELPGLLDTVAYVDLRKKTPEEFAEMVLKKIRQSG